MTNEEKAKEIAEPFEAAKGICLGMQLAALKMAQWKDEQRPDNADLLEMIENLKDEIVILKRELHATRENLSYAQAELNEYRYGKKSTDESK